MATSSPAPLAISPAVDRLARRLAVHLQAGRYSLAQRILAGAAEEMRLDQEERNPDASDDTPLTLLGLPVRVTNLLEAADILTVADVRAHSDGQLLTLRNLGAVQLREIRRRVRGCGAG